MAEVTVRVPCPKCKNEFDVTVSMEQKTVVEHRTKVQNA